MSSKSFSTDETLQSISLSKEWSSIKCNFDDHFIAVTSQPEKAKEIGFSNHNIIQFPNEIGGRYSMWSPISLPAILELGEEFIDFLKGGAEADNQLLEDKSYQEFIKTLCFSDIWYNNFVNKGTRVLLMYSWKMRFFKDYAQQLEMESIGKQPNINSIFKKTGQVIFGGFGSTAQHSYFQLLHQGIEKIPLDILISRKIINTKVLDDYESNYNNLVINAIAQAEALAVGSSDNIDTNKNFSGGRPSTIISWEKSNPYSIGMILALYENITISCGFIWNINLSLIHI